MHDSPQKRFPQPEFSAAERGQFIQCTSRANRAGTGRDARLARARALAADPAWPAPEDVAVIAGAVARRLTRESGTN